MKILRLPDMIRHNEKKPPPQVVAKKNKIKGNKNKQKSTSSRKRHQSGRGKNKSISRA
jgi:hypothetical protein